MRDDEDDDYKDMGTHWIDVVPCGAYENYVFDIYNGSSFGYGDSILYNIVPKVAKLSKLTKAKKAITVRWTAQKTKMAYDIERITGYQIQVATDKKFKKNVYVKGYIKASKKVTKLKKKKKYYVRIRTYYDNWGEGDRDGYICSSWSAYKTCKTK